jgi:hypothetical protein
MRGIYVGQNFNAKFLGMDIVLNFTTFQVFWEEMDCVGGEHLRNVTACGLARNQRYKQCCGSGMFIPDPGSEFFFHPGSRVKKILDPGSASKN